MRFVIACTRLLLRCGAACCAALIAPAAPAALAAEPQVRPQITVRLPANMAPASAEATAHGSNLMARGAVAGKAVSFDALLPDTTYDLSITCADGSTLQGVDFSWNGELAVDADAGDEKPAPLGDDDRRQIDAILAVGSFYDECRMLMLRGDHARAVGLVQLTRTRDFHASGGDVIWRIELWYFQFENGAWTKVPQQNRVLRRERLHGLDDLARISARIRWIAELGGVRIRAGAPPLVIDLPTSAASTRPASPTSTALPADPAPR